MLGGDAPPEKLKDVCEMTGATCVIFSGVGDASQTSLLNIPVVDADQIPDCGNPTSQHPWPGLKTTPEKPASIILTSGSTGIPKGVVQTHKTLVTQCSAVAVSLGYRDDDRLLCPVPWAHDYGWVQLQGVYFLGMCMILPELPGPAAASLAIGSHRPTIVGGVPSLYASFVYGASGIRQVDRGSVRLLTSTGSPFPQGVLDDVRSLFGSAGIALNYGLTETYRTTCLKPDEIDRFPGSVGRPINGVSIRIIRDDGTEVVPGEVGEVVHHGAGVFNGYWGDRGKTDSIRRRSSLFPGDDSAYEVSTGDYGRLDDLGYLYLLGRRDRIIKSMDVRVALDEVEVHLMASGLLLEAAVLDLPHRISGSIVAAAVVMKDGSKVHQQAIRDYSRSSLPQAMRPRHFLFTESLPRTSSGKTDYPTIRARFASPG
jgi:acyl-CoA synthetase (AMP-forming)/AMP-acid ligase II